MDSQTRVDSQARVDNEAKVDNQAKASTADNQHVAARRAGRNDSATGITSPLAATSSWPRPPMEPSSFVWTAGGSEVAHDPAGVDVVSVARYDPTIGIAIQGP
jgi:hypothetical protein